MKVFIYSTIFLIILFACKINGQRNNGNKRSSVIDSKLKLSCNNQTESSLDTYLYKLIGQKFPTNNRELRLFCNQGYRSLEYVQSYIKQCLPDFSQKVVSVVVFPIRRELTAICKTGKTSPKARELMKAAKCGNAARLGLRKCHKRFIESELAIKTAEQSVRIPQLCCEFNRLRECFKQEAEEIKECTTRTIDYVERWATEIYGEIMDIMCYEYPQASDKCDKVLLGIPKLKLDGVTVPKAFLSPLMSLMADLGQQEAKASQNKN